MTYLPSISRPSEDPSWKGLSGYLQDILASGVMEERTGLELSPEIFHIFLCGNPAMIEAAKPQLLELGFVQDRGREAGSLHTEEYW
jgi:ferredoxin--NADP+ reductase